MTAPNIQSVQYDNLTLYIIFDRAIDATLGQELDGFTFTVNPGASNIVPVFSSIDENAMICTLPGVINPGETLTVDYVSGSGTVVDALTGLDAAPSFSIDAVAYFVVALVMSAVAGKEANDVVSIYFSEPVGSPTDDLKLGITIEVDSVALDLTAAIATLSADQTRLDIATGVNFAYDSVIDVSYDDGVGDLYTWPAGAVASFSFDDIDNLSTDGLPNSDYPLSVVIAQPVVICQNAAKMCLAVSLNPIDIKLVQKYGPVTIFTGGTFGVTVANPDGVTIGGGFSSITDGAQICATFTSATNVSYAAAAALDWRDTMLGKISIALGRIRSIDQGVVFGDTVVEQV